MKAKARQQAADSYISTHKQEAKRATSKWQKSCSPNLSLLHTSSIKDNLLSLPRQCYKLGTKYWNPREWGSAPCPRHHRCPPFTITPFSYTHGEMLYACPLRVCSAWFSAVWSQCVSSEFSLCLFVFVQCLSIRFWEISVLSFPAVFPFLFHGFC